MIHLREPYRVFFPVGILCGLAGVAIWPLYSFGLTTTYSGRSHALVQIFGFLYAFIAGFLLTTVPRFTGTQPPSLVAWKPLQTPAGTSTCVPTVSGTVTT